MRSRGGEIVLLLLAGLGLAACTAGPEVARDPRPIPQRVEPPPTPEVAKPLPEIGEPADTPVLVGSVVKITDGDTIKVQLSSGPISVRFHSIDAPERDQPWGPEATAALASRLAGQVVDLEVVEQDRYERLIAVVYVNDENINAWLVQQGHAWAYRDYLEGSAVLRLGRRGTHERARTVGAAAGRASRAVGMASGEARRAATVLGLHQRDRGELCRCHAAVGASAGRGRAGGEAGSSLITTAGCVPHQGQHQRQRPDLSRAGQSGLRAH